MDSRTWERAQARMGGDRGLEELQFTQCRTEAMKRRVVTWKLRHEPRELGGGQVTLGLLDHGNGEPFRGSDMRSVL